MLEIKNLSYQVESQDNYPKEVLSDINFTVKDNSFLVITGPNGGGKSTLAKLIMGIEQPSSGAILWNGENITNMDVTERARMGIGFAFQQPIRFKGLTVKDLLSFATHQDLSVNTACEYLSEVGLCAADYVNRELNATLSGGELKRIEIAMLLARSPILSIFDEPEAGIDLWSFQHLIRVFQKMHSTLHGSIVIISHQERILEIADEIIVIANGKIASHGTREEILPNLLPDSFSCTFQEGEV